MSLKLDELLNPVPASGQRVGSEDPAGNHNSHDVKSQEPLSRSGVRRDSDQANTPSIAVTQAFEAANTLTALATQGSGVSTRGSPIHELPFPNTAGDRPPYRQNSLGGHIGVPLEPSTSATQDPPTHSPTLEQYHHGSRSPEEQRRRESLALRNSPPPVLAPLQNLAGHANGDAQAPHTGKHDEHNNRSSADKADGAVAEHSHPTSTASALPHIKTESSIIGDSASQLAIPASSAEPPSPAQAPDINTMAAIEAIKNEHGLRGGRAKATGPQDSSPDSAAKRPPAKSASKKGVAKKPPTKRRKIDKEDTAATGRPSPTPARSAKPKSGAVKGGSKSATPAIGSSPVPASNHEDEDDDGGSEDEELYCICRRKDDHSWMIACDGGCDDWFHGKCVHMKEADGPLIDKYICPNCEKKGDAVTTWKPMCRTEGCRNPARVAKSNASKYCSDECGVKFMKMAAEKTRKAHKENTSSAKKAKKRRREEHHDAYGASSDEEDLGPRGGMLRLGEVKALAEGASDIDSFRRLGDGVLSPPPSATEKPGVNGEVKPASGDDNSVHSTLLPNEDARLSSIANEKSAMRARMAILKDKEKFVAMAKDQVTRYAERENIKPKDVCGFDARLSWSEGEFDRWRQDTVGAAALESGVLELPPASNGVEVKDEEHQVNGDGNTNGADVTMTNGDNTGTSTSDSTGVFCAKKRCERHKQWQKIALQDVRFDEADLADRMRALEREEREIKERGMLRRRKEVAMGAGENSVQMVTS